MENSKNQQNIKNRIHPFQLFGFALSLFLADVSGAEPIRKIQLFQGTKFHPNYAERVSQLAKGDEITLPSGRKVLIQEVYKENEATQLFDIGEGWALRLPIKALHTEEFDVADAKRTMQRFLAKQKELRAENIPVIDINEERSELPFALVVKNEKILMTLEQFWGANQQLSKLALSAANSSAVETQLLDFFEKTWKFSDLGDVSTQQIGFNGQEWKVFNFYEHVGYEHRPIRNFKEKAIVLHRRTFETESLNDSVASHGILQDSHMPLQFEKAASARIAKIRLEQQKISDWYQRFNSQSPTTAQIIQQVTPSPLPGDFKVVFDTKNIRFDQDFTGFRPTKKSQMQIQFKKQIRQDGLFSVYQTVINQQIPAEVHLLKKVQGDSWKLLSALSQKADRLEKPYLVGSDFILYFQSKEAQRLKKMSLFDGF